MPSPPPPVRPTAERLELLLEMTERLQRLTAHLSTALRADDVAQIIVDEGTSALRAYSGGLWRVDTAANTLELMRAQNYPPAVMATLQRMEIDPRTPVADAVVRGEPVWLSSRADYEQRYPESAARTRGMTSTGYSVAALPIRVGNQIHSVLVLTFMVERGFDMDERSFLGFLTIHCAQAFERARLYEVDLAAKERAQFLAKASAVLGGSLDYEVTLANVASLAVPRIGDWCGVELLDESGASRQVAVAHVDPAKIELAHELRRRYPPDPNAKTGVPNVLRTGVSELYPEITDAMLVAGTRDEEHLRISRELGLHSAISVAIKDGATVVGAISFVSADPQRRYTADDVLMAEQLGDRAGAAIANAKLYMAARDAIRLRDEFMLVAGHELRTPLAALGLLHEAVMNVRDGTPLEKIRERGGKLRAQGQRLARLVEDLLDVSRMSAGRLDLELDNFDLGALVSEIGERMREEIERAQSSLHLDIEAVPGRWYRARIDQVVTNLIGNAAKYGRAAPIHVRVRRDGERAIVVVVDQGIGIPVEDQARIFKRFERAASSRKFGGLGLGLWIASQLAEAHGGTIEVASEPKKGATFTLSLPIAPAATR